MTEAEWLASDDPERILRLLVGSEVEPGSPVAWRQSMPGNGINRLSQRKLRLFACACWQRFNERGEEDKLLSYAIRSVERWADDGRRPRSVILGDIETYVFGGLNPSAAAMHTLEAVPDNRAAQAALLRDIVGNPFRPVTLPLRCRCGQWEDARDGSGRCKTCYGAMNVCPWLTPQVISMAQRIYDERDFSPDALGVLADALEDGDCPADSDLVRHLRGPGPHARGCWAVDLILGKE